MNINNLKSCITHDEATIRSFMRDPEYAKFYLQAVIADGDAEEISTVKAWAREARARSREASYWASLVNHAERTARNGYNVDGVVNALNEALRILKGTETVNIS